MARRITTNLSLSQPYRKYYKAIIQPKQGTQITDQFGIPEEPYELANPKFRRIPEIAFDADNPDRSAIEFSYRVPSYTNLDDVSTNELNSANQRMADFVLGLPVTLEELGNTVYYLYSLNPELTPQQFRDKYFNETDADKNLLIAPILNSYRAIFGDDEDTQKVREAISGMTSDILGTGRNKGTKLVSMKDAVAGMVDNIQRIGNGSATVSSTFTSLKELLAMLNTPVNQDYKLEADPGIYLRSFIHKMVFTNPLKMAEKDITPIQAIITRTAFLDSNGHNTLMDMITDAKRVLEIKSDFTQTQERGKIHEKMRASSISKIFTVFREYKLFTYVKLYSAIARMRSEYFNQYKYIRIQEQKVSSADKFLTKTITFDQFQLSIKNSDVAIMMDGHEKPIIQNMGGSANSLTLSIITNDMQILDSLVEMGIDSNLFRRQEHMLYDAYSIKAKGSSGTGIERFQTNFKNYVGDLVSKATGYDPNKIFDEPILVSSPMTQMGRIYGCTIDRVEIENVNTAVNTWRITLYLSGMDLSQKESETLKKVNLSASSFEHDLYLSEYMSPYSTMAREMDIAKSSNKNAAEVRSIIGEFAEDGAGQISKLKTQASVSISAIVEDLLFLCALARPYLKYRLALGKISPAELNTKLLADRERIKSARGGTTASAGERALVNTLANAAIPGVILATTRVPPLFPAAIAAGGIYAGLRFFNIIPSASEAIYNLYNEGSVQEGLMIDMTEMHEVLSIFDMALLALSCTYYKATSATDENFSLSMEDMLSFLHLYSTDPTGPIGMILKLPSEVPDANNVLGATVTYQGYTSAAEAWLKANFKDKKDAPNADKRILFYETMAMIMRRHLGLVNKDVPKDYGSPNYQIVYPRAELINLTSAFTKAIGAGGVKLMGEMLFYMMSFLFPGADRYEIDAQASGSNIDAVRRKGRTENDKQFTTLERLVQAIEVNGTKKIPSVTEEAAKIYYDTVVHPKSELDNPISFDMKRVNGNLPDAVDLKWKAYMKALWQEKAPKQIDILATESEIPPVSRNRLDIRDKMFALDELGKALRFTNFVEAGAGDPANRGDATATAAGKFYDHLLERYEFPKYFVMLDDNSSGPSTGYCQYNVQNFQNSQTIVPTSLSTYFKSLTAEETTSLTKNKTVDNERISNRYIQALSTSLPTGFQQDDKVEIYYEKFGGLFAKESWPQPTNMAILTSLVPYVFVTKSSFLNSSQLGFGGPLNVIPYYGYTPNTNFLSPNKITDNWKVAFCSAAQYLGVIGSNRGELGSETIFKFIENLKGALAPIGFSYTMKHGGVNNIRLMELAVQVRKQALNDGQGLLDASNQQPRVLIDVGEGLGHKPPDIVPDASIVPAQTSFQKWNALLSELGEKLYLAISPTPIPMANPRSLENENIITAYDYSKVVIIAAKDIDEFFKDHPGADIGKHVSLLLMYQVSNNVREAASPIEDRFVKVDHINANLKTYKTVMKTATPLLMQQYGVPMLREFSGVDFQNVVLGIVPLSDNPLYLLTLSFIAFTGIYNLSSIHKSNTQGPKSLALFPYNESESNVLKYTLKLCNMEPAKDDEAQLRQTDIRIQFRHTRGTTINIYKDSAARKVIEAFCTVPTPGIVDLSMLFLLDQFQKFKDGALTILTPDIPRNLIRSSELPANLFNAVASGACSPLLFYGLMDYWVRNGSGTSIKSYLTKMAEGPLAHIFGMKSSSISRMNKLKGADFPALQEVNGVTSFDLQDPDRKDDGVYSLGIPITKRSKFQLLAECWDPNIAVRLPSDNVGWQWGNNNRVEWKPQTEPWRTDFPRQARLAAYYICALASKMNDIGDEETTDVTAAKQDLAEYTSSVFVGNRATWFTAIAELYNNWERLVGKSTYPEPNQDFMAFKLDMSLAMLRMFNQGMENHLRVFISDKDKVKKIMEDDAFKPAIINWRQTVGGYATFYSFYGRPESLLNLITLIQPSYKVENSPTGFGIGAAIRLLPGGVGSSYRDMADAATIAVFGFDKYATEHYTRFFLPAIQAGPGTADESALLGLLGDQFHTAYYRSLARWRIMMRKTGTSILANDIGDTRSAYPDLPLPVVWKTGTFKTIMKDVTNEKFWEQASLLYPHVTMVVWKDLLARGHNEKLISRSVVENTFDMHMSDLVYLVNPTFYVENPFSIRERALADITAFFKTTSDVLSEGNGKDVELTVDQKRKMALETLRIQEMEILTEIRNILGMQVDAYTVEKIIKNLDTDLAIVSMMSSPAGRIDAKDYSAYLELQAREAGGDSTEEGKKLLESIKRTKDFAKSIEKYGSDLLKPK